MLVFPAEAADSGLAWRFDDGNVEDLAANLVVAFLTLFPGKVGESLVRDGFDKSIAEHVQRNAKGGNFHWVRYSFLNLRAGKGGIGTDRPIIHQRTVLDDFRSARDGYLWIHELAVGSTMADAQFRHLAGAAGSGILVALAAGLRVIERTEAVGDGFGLLKLGLIRRVRGVIHQPIRLVVEASRRLRKRRSKDKKGAGQEGNTDENFHRYLGGWSGESTLRPLKSQPKQIQGNTILRYKTLMDEWT